MKTEPLEMEILHDPSPDRYSIVDNKLIEHPKLSADSKAVAIYLFSRTKDWTIRIADVERFLNAGREKRQRIFKELIAAGYLEMKTLQNKRGHWTKAYQLHRKPKKSK
jgi:hypothetical protein